MSELKSSKDWLRESPNIVVLDPDGWDRRNLKESMEELVTKDEFMKRLWTSTVVIMELPTDTPSVN